MITKAVTRAQKNLLTHRRFIALQYLLSRLNNMASVGDSAHDILPQLAATLELQLNLPYASREIRENFSNDECDCLERLLTGQLWADDGGRLVGS